ncbi:MAG: type I-E CRISPR-associated protein Cas6/Cse3/CasE [Acidimicrobiales bacterium]
MTVLTRIRLHRDSRYVLRLVSNPVELHRRVMIAFDHVDGPAARESLGVLWRYGLDAAGRPTLTVQSNSEGDWSSFAKMAESVESKNIDAVLDSLKQGQVLRFLLRANATRKIRVMNDLGTARSNGTRVPLRTPERALDWLVRHGEPAGFEVVKRLGAPAVDISSEPPSRGRRGPSVVTVEGTLFEGLLTVRDPQALARAARVGIGPAKAYGCGLLSLASARSG